MIKDFIDGLNSTLFPRCQLCQDRIGILQVLYHHGYYCTTCIVCIEHAAEHGVDSEWQGIVQDATAAGLTGQVFRLEVVNKLCYVIAYKETYTFGQRMMQGVQEGLEKAFTPLSIKLAHFLKWHDKVLNPAVKELYK